MAVERASFGRAGCLPQVSVPQRVDLVMPAHFAGIDVDGHDGARVEAVARGASSSTSSERSGFGPPLPRGSEIAKKGQAPDTGYNLPYMERLAIAVLLASTVALAASPEEFATSAGMLQITPIQHASLMIQAGGKVLYLDPAQGKYDGLPQADYILITDIQGDHLVPALVDKLKKAGTVILAPKAVAEKVAGCTVISNGETKTIGSFKVEAIPMYNLQPAANGTVYHEKGRGNGYVLTYGGKRFYFSGDTEGTPEMKALRNIDVAFVCMNVPYTMSPEAAAVAVRAFHPAIVYPYHYGQSDLTIFQKALAGSGIEVRIRDWYPK